MGNAPQEITLKEWSEIMRLPEFEEGWGPTSEPVESFVDCLYGVRFDFVSGGPGYFGPLYIVHGDALSGAPLVVIRGQSGELAALATAA